MLQSVLPPTPVFGHVNQDHGSHVTFWVKKNVLKKQISVDIYGWMSARLSCSVLHKASRYSTQDKMTQIHVITLYQSQIPVNNTRSLLLLKIKMLTFKCTTHKMSCFKKKIGGYVRRAVTLKEFCNCAYLYQLYAGVTWRWVAFPLNVEIRFTESRNSDANYIRVRDCWIQHINSFNKLLKIMMHCNE